MRVSSPRRVPTPTTPGLLLIVVGLYVLVKGRHWPLLIFTGAYFLLQQGFNLFYAIGDIFVYYIPLFWLGSIWAGMGALAIGERLALFFEDLRSQQLALRSDVQSEPAGTNDAQADAGDAQIDRASAPSPVPPARASRRPRRGRTRRRRPAPGSCAAAG